MFLSRRNKQSTTFDNSSTKSTLLVVLHAIQWPENWWEYETFKLHRENLCAALELQREDRSRTELISESSFVFRV